MRYGTNANEMLKRTMTASAVALALSIGTAAAQDAEETQVAAAQGADDKQARWETMREQYVNARDLLEADVTNGLNTVGEVSNLVLTPDGSAIEHVLIEASWPYLHAAAANHAFVPFESIELQNVVEARVGVDFTGDAMQTPDRLELTAAEADHRLVGAILDSQMYFTDGGSYQIKDLIVDQETGQITHYVVSMDTETLFDLDRVTVPADQVSIGEGGTVEADVTSSSVVDTEQEFDEEFLY